jgi:hypothetical protein
LEKKIWNKRIWSGDIREKKVVVFGQKKIGPGFLEKKTSLVPPFFLCKAVLCGTQKIFGPKTTTFFYVGEHVRRKTKRAEKVLESYLSWLSD